MNSILMFFLNFSDYRIGLFSLADYALILLVTLALPLIYKERHPIKILVYTSFLLFGAVCSFCLNVTKEYFSITEYLSTFLKLAFYMCAVLLIPGYLSMEGKNIIKILRVYLYAAVAGAVAQLALVRLFGVESWPLYSLGGNFFGIHSPDTMLVNNGMIRARSFYTEPAAFTVGITLVFLLLLYKGSERFDWKDNLVYVVGIISANSFSGYGMAVLVYVVYFFQIRNRKKLIRMLWLVIPGMVAIVGLLTFNGYLRGRIINLFALKDRSGVVRTVGGFHFLYEIPPYGVGLGNQSLYYHSLNLDANEQIWYSGSGEFYNIILVSIITMGYIGGVGLLIYQYYILRKDKRLFLSLLITHFATGRLYTPSLWVFLIFYLTIIEREKQDSRNCENRKELSG